MKQGTVKFSKEFITPIGLKEWASCEMEYDMSSEDPKEVLTAARNTVNEWYESNCQVKLDGSIPPGPSPVINVQRTSEDVRVAELIRDIYACTELEGDNGLLSYSKLAGTNREAQNCFDIMFMKLSAPPSFQSSANQMGKDISNKVMENK